MSLSGVMKLSNDFVYDTTNTSFTSLTADTRPNFTISYKMIHYG